MSFSQHEQIEQKTGLAMKKSKNLLHRRDFLGSWPLLGLIKVCLLQKDDLTIAIMAITGCCLFRRMISPGAESVLTYQFHEATIEQQDAEGPTTFARSTCLLLDF